MRKPKENEYSGIDSGIEDFTPKKNRKKRGEEVYSHGYGEDKKQRGFPIERFKSKKALAGLAAFFLVILLLVVLFKFVITNDKDTAEDQLYKVIKAHTDREYIAIGGKSMKGKDLWRSLGVIDKENYEAMSPFWKQEFANDVIAAGRKAAAQESVEIGGRTYSTKHVNSDTLKAWVDGIEITEGADHNLVTTFHDDIQPAFIPAYDGLTLPKLALIALVIFVIICIFFPKSPYGRRASGHRRGSIS